MATGMADPWGGMSLGVGARTKMQRRDSGSLSGGLATSKVGALGGRLGNSLQAIGEDKSQAKKPKPEPHLQTALGKSFVECKDTYGTMSAKARGEKIHPSPPKPSKPRDGRDCTEWVRKDKQYSPYSYFESPSSKPSPKPAKPSAPPALWLPTRAKEPKMKGDVDDMKLGAEAGEDEADNETLEAEHRAGEGLEKRPPWDSEHHMMFSRMNHEVQSGCREYFDRPIRTEGEGIPKVRERYAMNDRQCCWDDTPAPFGEYRKTLYDNIGPYNRGGCKDQQLPSYWRKIKDWGGSQSSPELRKYSLSGAGRPKERSPLKDRTLGKAAMLMALADTPADQTKEFWRKWAEGQSAPNSLPEPSNLEMPRGWDGRFNICWSRANDTINQRQREYFSVPEGSTGTATEKARPRRSPTALNSAADGPTEKRRR